MPAQTHVAMAHAVEICGAKPVFVDAEPRDRQRRPGPAGEPGHRAHPRDLGGALPGPARWTWSACWRSPAPRDLFVVEDCAIALGASHRRHPRRPARRHRLLLLLSRQAHHHGRGRHGHHHPRGRRRRRSPSSARSASTSPCWPTAATPAAYEIEYPGLNYRLGEIGAAIGVRADGAAARVPGGPRAQLRRWPPRAWRRSRAYACSRRGTRATGAPATTACRAVLDEPLADRREEVIDQPEGTRGRARASTIPRRCRTRSYYCETYGYAKGSCPVATADQHVLDRLPRRSARRGRTKSNTMVDAVRAVAEEMSVHA